MTVLMHGTKSICTAHRTAYQLEIDSNLKLPESVNEYFLFFDLQKNDAS